LWQVKTLFKAKEEIKAQKSQRNRSAKKKLIAGGLKYL